MDGKVETHSDVVRQTSVAGDREISPWITFLFSLTCALAVANVYSAQPLLESMACSLNVEPGLIGSVVTLTQTGYLAGLLFLVPLGDRLNRKILVITLLGFSVVALIAAGLAKNLPILLCAMLLIGLMAVVVQLMVAWAAILATPHKRGAVVGQVTSGIVLGILLARFISGTIADLAGWRAVYLVAACLMMIIAFVLAKVMPASPPPVTKSRWSALMLSVFRLYRTEPQLRTRGVLALLIFAAFSML